MAALTTFSEDLEKELTCSTCNEIFTDPKSLPCLHSYCSKCIYEYSHGAEDFSCPLCRTRVNLSDVRSSLYLNSLLRLLYAMSNEDRQEQCICCGKDFKIVAFCPQCNGTICFMCVYSHKKMKTLREEHKVTMLDEFKQENVDDFIKNQMLCKEKFHENSKLVYYCKEKTCKRFICHFCFTLSHKQHDLSLIEEEAEQAKLVIQDYTNRLDHMAEKLVQKFTFSKQNLSRIETEISSAKQKVKEEGKAIIKKAKDHAIKVLNDLDRILLDQQEENKEEQDNTQTAMEHIDQFQEYNETLLNKNVTLQILESYEGVKLRGQATERFLESFTRKPAERLSIHYQSNEKAKRSLKNIGKIVKDVAVTDDSRFLRQWKIPIIIIFILCLATLLPVVWYVRSPSKIEYYSQRHPRYNSFLDHDEEEWR